MSDDLPARIDPFRLAYRAETISGTVPVAEMVRLAGMVDRIEGPVTAVLGFSRNEAGRAVMSGRVSGCVVLTCQRCLEPMKHGFDLDFEVILVEDEDNESEVMTLGEPLLVTGRALLLREALEDEIILGLPVAPRHPAGEPCPLPTSPDQPDQGEARPNPFASLAVLRRETDK